MNPFFYISPLILQTAIWPITRPLFWFFLHLEVSGLDGLKSVDRKNGVIFAANHGSEFDPVYIPAGLPFLSKFMPMFYTSRERSFYKKSGWRQIFYGGLLFELWGSHALHSGKQNYEESLKTHIQILKDGKSVLMFPDGKILPESEIGSIAHGGVGYLAWRTKSVIIPVRIANAHRIDFASFTMRHRAVEVIFGAPLTAETLGIIAQPSVEDCRNAARAVMLRVSELSPVARQSTPGGSRIRSR